jgi:hypothetical protein
VRSRAALSNLCCHFFFDVRWIRSENLWLFSRTGDSRGFAFVRYKYADEAQKAVDRLDGASLTPPIFRGQIWVHLWLTNTCFV